jgi:hypothetical protein
MESLNATESTIDAFSLMWGNYPGPAMLLNKKHDILAVNKAGKHLGLVPGIKCHSLTGKDRMCPGCKAPMAL